MGIERKPPCLTFGVSTWYQGASNAFVCNIMYSEVNLTPSYRISVDQVRHKSILLAKTSVNALLLGMNSLVWVLLTKFGQ